MRDLLRSPRRFGELEDSLGGMSPRTLAKKLKALERETLITRHPLSRPARVEYRITKKGAAFNSVVEAMRRYGEKYL